MMSKALRLSIALAAMLTASTACEASLINNGSFEQVVVGPTLNGLIFGQDFNTLGTGGGNQNWDVYSSLPGGWYTTSTDPAGFEVQTNPTLTTTNAQDGTHYIELESHPDNPSASNILQNFTVAAGDAGLYMLSFFYQPRTNIEDDNLINAIFGGITTTVSGPPDPAFSVWTEIQVFAHLATGPHILEFNAFGTLLDNTYGGFIDNVSVNLIRKDDNPIVPLPAGLILLFSGLMGLGFLGRARTKSV